jgi:hypothetical protein
MDVFKTLIFPVYSLVPYSISKMVDTCAGWYYNQGASTLSITRQVQALPP